MPVPRPQSAEHKKLKDLVVQRLTQSEDLLQSRHKRWRESERSYRLFVDPDQIQEPVEPISEQAELLYPYPTSVVVPLSYAMTQTIISFWVALFTSSQPYLKVGNRNPESAGAAKAQELLISYQLDYWGWVPNLYQWLLDSCRYGLGINKCCWRIDERMQTVKQQQQVPILGQMFNIPMQQKQTITEYEGNYNEVLDPFTWRPDPRHPVANFQDGSYCGEALYRSYFDLLRKQSEGLYENVESIPQLTLDGLGNQGRGGTLNQSDRNRIMQVNSFFGQKPDPTDAGMVLVESATVDIIPKDVGIGAGTGVERWLVVVANRTVVIRAEEYPYEHNKFYYSIIESSPDKHSLLNPGVMELMEPISQHISWLYNSHLENVRKALNDQFVVDPDRVEMDDILNPAAGKIIRLRPNYYGTGVDGAVKQLDVGDVTKDHINTAEVLSSLLQRLSAANDALQGQQEDSNKTATEVNMVTNLASGRLRTLAKMISAQGLTPMAKQMCANNANFLSQEQYLKLAGSLEQEYQAIGRAVEGGVMISPEDIQGQFDFPIFDASSPLDPIRYAQAWMQIAQMGLQNPSVAPYLDHMSLFKQVVHSMGITDIARFILPPQMQVMPDQQVQQQEQQGNLVPMPGQNGQVPQPPPPGQMNGGGTLQ
jgi:hypothetical protein